MAGMTRARALICDGKVRGRIETVIAVLLGSLAGTAVLEAGFAGMVVTAMTVAFVVKLTAPSRTVSAVAFVFGAAAAWATMLFPAIGTPACRGPQIASICYSSGSEAAAFAAAGVAVVALLALGASVRMSHS